MPGSILGKDHLIVNKVRRKQKIQLDLPGGGSRHTGGKWSQTSQVSDMAHMTRKSGWAFFCSVVPYHFLHQLWLTIVITVVQSLSRVQLFATPWTAARQVSLSFTISWSLLKLMVIELVMPSNRLVLCGPLLLLPSVFPSIRVFATSCKELTHWKRVYDSCALFLKLMME